MGGPFFVGILAYVLAAVAGSGLLAWVRGRKK